MIAAGSPLATAVHGAIFNLTEHPELAIFRLAGALDPATRQVRGWAQAFCAAAQSYTEQDPDGSFLVVGSSRPASRPHT